MLSTAPELDLAQLKETFARDGFAVVPSVFSPEEIEEIKENFERLHAERKGFWDDGVRDEKDPLFNYPRLVHPHRFDATARRYMLHPRIVECLRVLFSEEPVAVQSMYYFKPPGARGQPMHQDNLYLLVEPGTCIAAWTAIDRVDRQNGGMLLVPGTHRGNLLCQENDVQIAKEHFSTNITRIPAGMKAVDCPMNPGDTLFFGGTVIHGSGPNRTKDRFRRSFIGHYAAGSLEKISKFYLPLVRLDGTDAEVAANIGGGVCGGTWEGSLH
jgi:ectoine hydroxylase-related dioxygenase (phytanoyl-CoA dioxygenase family)